MRKAWAFVLAFILIITLHGVLLIVHSSHNTPVEEKRVSFSLRYDGFDTGVEVFFKDCNCEYDRDSIQVYTCFVDEPTVEVKGYAIYIQTPEETMDIFPVKEYQIDSKAGRLYMIWGIEEFERIQGVDFVNGINGYKVESVSSVEYLIGEANGLELLENGEDFQDLQVEFVGMYEENEKTVLRGRASALYNGSDECYSIEWDIDTE